MSNTSSNAPAIEIPKISTLSKQTQDAILKLPSISSVESPHSQIFSFDSSDSSFSFSSSPTPTPTVGSPPSPVGSVASFGSPTFPDFVSASSRKDRAINAINDPYSTSAPLLLSSSSSTFLRNLTSSPRTPEMDHRAAPSSAPASSSSSSSSSNTSGFTSLNSPKLLTKRPNHTMAGVEVLRELNQSDDTTKSRQHAATAIGAYSLSKESPKSGELLGITKSSSPDEEAIALPDDALHQALDRTDDPNTLQTVEQLLAHNANVNSPDAKGRTPLHIAVINSNLEAALLLVDHGADIMCQSTLVPRSPLNLALLNANLSGLDTDKTMQEKMKRLAALMQERYVIAQIKKNVETKSDVLLIENCSITNFGNGIHTLTWLKTLYLGHNLLEVIPASIQNLKLLEVLDLPNNKIRELPAAINELTSLRKLNLKNNKLDNLPVHLAFLTSLKELIVEGNPLKKLPVEMRKAPTPKLLSFLSDMSTGSILCNRIRLIFVGQEGAGKTSLVKVLSSKEPKLKGGLPSTDGIEVSDWVTDDLTFHCWDFGGQELFYPSHQYFLSSSCIYLATFNLDDESTIQRLEYWVRTVNVLSPSSPIVMIGTHCDAKRCSEKYINKVFASLFQKFGSFPQIAGYHAVSSSKGQGIRKLKSKLVEVARSSQLVTSHLPRSYLMLEEWIATSRDMYYPPVISWSEYEKIAAKSGVLSKNLLTATDFLMTMGVLVHFNKTEDSSTISLSDSVILDASWLTKVMSSLVSFSHSFAKKDGLLKPEELQHIWRPPDYPTDMHATLIAILEKFEVLFKLKKTGTAVSDGPYLIPSLLPPTCPDDTIRDVWDNKARTREVLLSRQYECEFLPLGFFGRCIVRLLPFLNPIAFWRTGILASFGKNQKHLVFVRMESAIGSKVNLTIQVKGPTPANLMHSVVECIDKLIDFWYGNLAASVTRKVVCPHCIQERKANPSTFPLQKIQEALVDGTPEYMSCNGTSVPMKDLVVDVFLTDPTVVQYSAIKFDSGANKKLGEGAFSVVSLGKLRDEVVAVKELKMDIDVDKIETFRQFALEAFYLRAVSHPCIVGLTAVCFRPLCMILECVPHGTLYDVIHSKTDITPVMRLKIADNIASAIKRLHSIKPPVIHRDLKTPNILVASLDASSTVLVKLADMGLSCRATSEVKRDRDLTNLDWMAPEVMRQQPFTEKADVFSFGIILWELVSRQHPYEEFKFNFMVQKEDSIAGGIRPTVPRGIQPGLSKLIEECWDHQPTSRPNFGQIQTKISKLMRETGTPERSFLGQHKTPHGPLSRSLGIASSPLSFSSTSSSSSPSSATITSPSSSSSSSTTTTTTSSSSSATSELYGSDPVSPPILRKV